jgi:putative phosphoribosyl transferase
VTAREFIELERRERLYRGARIPLDVTGQTVIIMDDGIATGSTMRAHLALSIKAADGTTALLSFRAVIVPEKVDAAVI